MFVRWWGKVLTLRSDSVVRIWWYHHQGVIQTTGINFLTDLPHFLALLFALQRFDVEDWGLIPPFDLGASKGFWCAVRGACENKPELKYLLDLVPT